MVKIYTQSYNQFMVRFLCDASLSGRTAKMSLCASAEDDPVLTLEESNPTIYDNYVVLTITTAQSSDLTPGRYVADVAMIDEDGEVIRSGPFQVEVVAHVTDAS